MSALESPTSARVASDWLVATVARTTQATPGGRILELDVPDWPGSVAGQHLDLRLTAEDGYQAVRSYSIASVGAGGPVELAVDQIPEGEVSPHLTMDVEAGDQMEVRGPLGGWFIWDPASTEPVQLIAGGSGIVPLVAMVRSHARSGSTAPMHLLTSVRTRHDAFYWDELNALDDPHTEVSWRFTRRAPSGWDVPVGRLDHDALAASVIPAAQNPSVFVCGPTAFVEAVATVLVDLGHEPARVRTERFGGA